MNISKVMLVDDDPDIRTVGKLSLGSVGGFEVVLAASGREALECVQREHPDLILLDVMMPGMDGLTTFHELARLTGTPPVPVVFMTAKVRKQEVEQYLAMGAAGVVAKPFDPMTLAEEIRRIASRI